MMYDDNLKESKGTNFYGYVCLLIFYLIEYNDIINDNIH